MIPAFPSASYFAEGLVITSICFTDDAGICFKTSLPFNVVGLPSIRTTKSELPRKVTLPCGSTCTEGVFSRAVAELPPALFKSFSTFTTLRSILYSTFLLSAVTVTSLRLRLCGLSFTSPDLKRATVAYSTGCAVSASITFPFTLQPLYSDTFSADFEDECEVLFLLLFCNS